MRVTLTGFKQDSDTDFGLIPETVAERTLLRAMRGRKVELIQEEHGNINDQPVMKFRAVVIGKRI